MGHRVMLDINQYEEEIQHESLNDFFDDFREAHERCEIILIELEHTPDSTDLLNDLFRVAHTIKGNLIYVGLASITPIMQSLEDLLDYIRKGYLHYDSLLCDVILLSLDRTKKMVEARIDDKPLPMSESVINSVCENITMIADVKREEREKYVKKILIALDPSAVIKQEPKPEQSLKAVPELHNYQEPDTVQFKQLSEMLTDYGIPLDEDLHFYMGMVTPLENRSHYWRGRTARQLFLCMEMNRLAGYPVDKTQLAVAVMLHDLGMSFMPLTILNKKGPITSKERDSLHNHPNSGYLLLNESIHWHDAAVMILHHHEQVDGSGYPSHLTQDQICEGAKILSIADTFDARTHERAHVTLLRRPLVRTIVEINNFKGTQFDVKWVSIFNQVVKLHFKSQ
ncbi:putative Signal transduction histidine kinase fused with Metal dependent phosphohydrolase [Vibrio tapetis subsp. tapetis]|uniref:Putative Signal transduction histidine kinase fused with Metal dependent phosphohydrolase n=2 Tax=Vibrio tapetis TaxID=52443 RepID=A0A2N8Z8Z8_9VIBR|nr:putative Signal transduction histidine kinase fused with Metal dependent phosphohydrolase [Vibrio tapetis subsp. tapetis]